MLLHNHTPSLSVILQLISTNNYYIPLSYLCLEKAFNETEEFLKSEAALL